MGKRERETENEEETPKGVGGHFAGWLLFPLALFPLVALLSYDWRAMPQLNIPAEASSNWVGALGDYFAFYGYQLLGLAVWVLPVACMIWGICLVAGRRMRPGRRELWFTVFVVASACLVQMLEGHAAGVDTLMRRNNYANAGGAVGYLVMEKFLTPLLSGFGSTVIMLMLLVFSLVAAIGLHNLQSFFAAIVRWVMNSSSPMPPRANATKEEQDAYRAALAAREAARAEKEAERERIRREKEEAKAAKLAAKEAERAAKEAERAAREAEREAEREKMRQAKEALHSERQALIDKYRAERQRMDEESSASDQGGIRRAQIDQPVPITQPVQQTQQMQQQPMPPVMPQQQQPLPQMQQPIQPIQQQMQQVPAAQPTEDEAAAHADKGPYVVPGVDLLKPIQKNVVADHGDVDETSRRLIDTLKLFGIEATLSYTVRGPVVTKYAVELAPGTRYSVVTNISANLMGAMHARSLRIEAPIPGEDRVGIEVPNRKPVGISFREIFESKAWKESKAELPLLFGKDAAGKELIADLATMPHMLVAGATGQGKSVCLNALINGLLMTKTPDQLKFIMVDPKSVEFAWYSTIPHLLVPVITDNRKVVFALHWAVAEMEKRLKLFTRARVKNIYDFNHRKTVTQPDMFGNSAQDNSDIPKTIPYIIVIIDEVADLMSTSAKEVTPDISRLTAKARAAGIHLILATQRPDAKVITGTIKANIPGRVAFKTAQAIDSRTILDEAGAENLIGRGDMLFKGKDGLLIRAQGAWISDEEIGNITQFIEEHADTQFDEKFATKLGRVKEAAIEDPFASNEDDPDNQPQEDEQSAPSAREQVKAAESSDLYKRAIEVIINTNRASVSHFQRKLGIGYNHAAKICDKLEENGVIAPQSGAGPRTILLDQNQLLAIMNGGTPATAEPETPPPDGTDEQAADYPAQNDEEALQP